MTRLWTASWLAALLTAAGLYACATTRWTERASSCPAQSQPELRAGAAREDITPPPGPALFGHGPEGRVSAGFRTRLYARAFVFEQAGEVVALVSCDLGAPSLELQRRVANKLVLRNIPIGAQRLLLMATHTHAGPAHFFGARLYSSAFASRDPGFDPRVLEFLAERIASAVARAWSTRVAAQIGWQTRELWDLTRNRSYAAFSANIGHGHIPLPPPLDQHLSDPKLRDKYSPARLAVDPTLFVLRIDRAQDAAPIGVFAVFGMHQTAIANTNDLFHADVFGYATHALEASFARSTGREPEGGCVQQRHGEGADCPIIVGIANGIEGDVSPAADLQAPREAKRLGERLAGEIESAWRERAGRKYAESKSIVRYYRELRFPSGRIPNATRAQLGCSGSVTAPPCLTEKLCDSPQLGAASGGGAEDGPTWLRALPVFQEGARRASAEDCHRFKRPLVPPGGLPGSDGLDFPALGPIELVRLGDGLIAAAPAELTTWVGLQIRAQIRRTLEEPEVNVAIAGLTNAYFQYVASPYEYDLQHYEGASTLYGPSSAAFLIGHFGCLAAVMRGEKDACGKGLGQPEIDALEPAAYAPTYEVSRLPELPQGLPEIVTLDDLTATPLAEDGVAGWRIEWEGVRPGDLMVGENARVDVEALDRATPDEDAGIADHTTTRAQLEDNDRGTNISVRYLGGRRWAAHWVPGFDATMTDKCNKHYRFVVRGAVRVRSRPFMFECEGMQPAAHSEGRLRP